MQRRGAARGAFLRFWPVLCCALLSGCSRYDSAIEGTVVFDGQVPLVRGAQRDTAQREWRANAAATFVAIVEEDNLDVRLRLERFGAANSPATFVDVESHLSGEGIEVAALDVEGGDRIVASFETGRVFAEPRSVKLKVLRYDAAESTPAVRARVQSFRDWTAATQFTITQEEVRKVGLPGLDSALSHLQSDDGDAYLAAWARLVRSTRSYNVLRDWRAALEDARLAERAFARLGESRNAARARFEIANALTEIAVDRGAADSAAEEAEREAFAMLRELAVDPALSPRERANSINMQGYLAYSTQRASDAEAWFRQALAAYRVIGDGGREWNVLGNLAAMTYENGDLQASIRFYDQLVPRLDEFPLPTLRAAHLYNAAMVDVMAGNTDRGIERFLLLLQWAREMQMPHHEARALHGLGLAYRQRGDLAQATTLIEAGLKARQGAGDPEGEYVSLQVAGEMAREAGDTTRALALHRQALKLATNEDARLRILTEMALDHAAAGDLDRAVETGRLALARYSVYSTAFRRRPTELALAEALLARRARTTRDVEEAGVLAARVLEGAIASTDITQEQAARKTLAQVEVARGRFDAARQEYERAIALIFKYRATTSSPEQRATVLVRTASTFRGYIDLLMRDVAARGAGRLMPAGAAEEDALRVLESARVINFDSVRATKVDAAAQTRIDALLEQMAGKRVRMAAMQDRASAPGPELARLQLDIAKLRSAIDRERARGVPASTLDEQPRELSQPWPAIAGRVTQLSYALGENNAYLWVRDTTGIRATVLARTPAAIARELDRLATLRRSHSPMEVEQAYRRISEWLLPEGAISARAETLEVVAEGRLASVPFPILAPDRSVAMISSMFEGAGSHDAEPERALRFVAVWSGKAASRKEAQLFPALLTSRSEAHSIAALFERESPASAIRLLTGDEGTTGEIRSAWIRGANVFHFATHGLADLRQPLASLLMLPAHDENGAPVYLTAGQVQAWRGDADLVYLSACETAVGPARFADGMPGLQRAFLRAGARGVIATLWPIEDVYASQFAVDFYRRYTAGVPALQALSETQREWGKPAPGLAAREQAHRRMTAWAHVYYTQ